MKYPCKKVGSDSWIVELEAASHVCGCICKTSCDMMECKLIYTGVLRKAILQKHVTARAAMSECELWVILVTVACLIEASLPTTQARLKLKMFQRDRRKKAPTRVFMFPSSLLLKHCEPRRTTVSLCILQLQLKQLHRSDKKTTTISEHN